MAQKLHGKYGVVVKPLGNVDNSPFPKAQLNPGENIWTALDRYARMRNVILSSDAAGEAVLIGYHSSQIADSLIEGVNIKKMQFTVSIEDTWQDINVLGQTSGSDEQNMGGSNEMKASIGASACVPCKVVIPVEEPVQSEADLFKRAKYEQEWTDGTRVTANITVQGWFSRSGLWRAGQSVYVNSPMCPVSQVLKVKTCTWTQDNENGTETTLECVNPIALKDEVGLDTSD
jgi:prophage tail gpP-like protein